MTDWQTITLDRPLLLEASAGTGKTFAIEHLVLRALWEQRVRLDAMLVMTYTRAAAEDLRARILARLQRALGLLGSPEYYRPDSKDSATIALLHRWLELPGSVPDCATWFLATQGQQSTARWREIRQVMQEASRDAHRAWVGTTHSLCQRILSRYQLESGVLESQDISGHDSTLQLAVEAWWLEQFCHLDASVRELMPGSFGTVQMWHGLARYLPRGHSASSTILVFPHARIPLQPGPSDVLPDANAGASYVRHLQALDSAIQSTWRHEGLSLLNQLSRDYLAGEIDRNRVRSVEGFESPWDKFAFGIATNLASVRADDDVWRLFTEDWLARPIYKKAHAIKNAELPRHPWVQAWSRYVIECQRTLEQLQSWCVEWFARWVLDYLARHHSVRVATFDQLSQRVLDALASNPEFAARMRGDFPFAIVDEFQDTDPVQWGIVRTLYCQSDSPGSLVLVGDPKQAIYSFRGADLACYGDARRTVAAGGAMRVLELRHNRRSSQALVGAFNTLFSGALWSQPPFVGDSRPHPAGADGYVEALAGQPNVSQLPAALELVITDEPGKGAYAGWVADQLHALLQRDRTIEPGMLAVITQKNSEAEEMYEALLARGLPAQLQRSATVWGSVGALYAQQVLELLMADATSVDLAVLTALPWQSALRTQDDVRQVQRIWRQIGLYASALRLCGPGAEPLKSWDRRGVRHWADFLHACELCDQHLSRHSPQAVLRWLSQQRAAADLDPFHGGDEAQARQSVGTDAVRVMTAHGSKGLEFDYVFIPFAFRERPSQDLVLQVSALGELGPERHLYLAQLRNGGDVLDGQSQSENLRLLYVAITRARRYVWLGWQRSYQAHKYGPLPHLLSGKGRDTKVDDVLQMAVQAEALGVRIGTHSSYLNMPVQSDVSASVDVLQPTYTPQRLSVEALYDGSASSFTALHGLQQRYDSPLERDTVVPELQEQLFAAVPRGAQGGLFVHAMLETIARDPSLADDAVCAEPSAAWTTLQSQAAAMQGLTTSQMPSASDWQALLNAPLGLSRSPGTSLTGLLQQSEIRWPEVDFGISVPEGFVANELPAELAQVFRDLPWHGDRIEGQMDLVVRWQGRWQLLDYKTNALPQYDRATLEAAMQQAGYTMQAWIYWAALTRHAMRMDGVAALSESWYDASMGQVLYLFVRGIHASVQQGIWSWRPAYSQVANLLRTLEKRS